MMDAAVAGRQTGSSACWRLIRSHIDGDDLSGEAAAGKWDWASDTKHCWFDRKGTVAGCPGGYYGDGEAP